MPEPIVPDVPAVAPSATPSAIVLTDADPLDTLNDTELQDWRMTGKMPDAKTTPAASSAATVVQDPPASTDAPIAPASEAGTPRPDPRATENRVPELLADRKRERDRADRAERELAELRRQPQPPTDARPAAPSPAPAGLVEPDPDAFPYGAADPGYIRAVAKFEAAALVASERAQYAAAQTEHERRQEHQRVVTAFEAKAAAARTAHPDFDAVALEAPTDIPQGSAVDLWILEDEAGAEILYHLQQPANGGERKRILALGPREQLRELVRLGDRLTATAPAPRSTNAPPPPPTLGTRTTPTDAVDRALADGDSDEATGAWMAAQNKRDLLRLKR